MSSQVKVETTESRASHNLRVLLESGVLSEQVDAKSSVGPYTFHFDGKRTWNVTHVIVQEHQDNEMIVRSSGDTLVVVANDGAVLDTIVNSGTLMVLVLGSHIHINRMMGNEVVTKYVHNKVRVTLLSPIVRNKHEFFGSGLTVDLFGRRRSCPLLKKKNLSGPDDDTPLRPSRVEASDGATVVVHEGFPVESYHVCDGATVSQCKCLDTADEQKSCAPISTEK